ncbi:MAG TPA: hypothetical protein VHJ20_09680 [Polyangia bacterium]|nr:hypothetical protein [Polyangia bacterium]
MSLLRVTFVPAVVFALGAAFLACGSITPASNDGGAGKSGVTGGDGGSTGAGGTTSAGGSTGGGGVTGAGGTTSSGGTTGAGGTTSTGGANGSGGVTGGGGATSTGGSGGATSTGGSGGTTGSGGATGGGGSGGATGGGGAAGCTRVKGCCLTNADCSGDEECVGGGCPTKGTATRGVCKAKPTARAACWSNADCGALTPTCEGASVCACGEQCLLADKAGTCKLLAATTN